MRIAIVDLGTNTFNLLIADVLKEKISVIYAGREVVKLGEKSINENRIADAAFARGIKAFIAYTEIIKKHQPKIIKVLATSAIREAHNGLDFITETKKLTGIETTIITGEKEAELIYLGNRIAVEMNDEAHLIMDIGGGSTEFIIANNKTVFWKQSYKLGVARLLEKFKPENPASKKTIQSINDYLNQSLQSLLGELKKHKINCLIGSAGAFETVVDMIGKENSSSGKSCYEIDLRDYNSISKKTIQSTAEEREHMSGLIPMRRDMIVLSYLLIDFIVKNAGIKQVKVSTYSLKEGALFEIINATNC